MLISYFGLDCSPRGEGQYELFMPDGTSRFATNAEILQAQKKMLQDHAYKIAAQKLNTQSADYGDAEKALWGLLQKDVAEYNTSGIIGATLQQAVDDTLGLHTVETLSAKLTAWANYQRAVLQARATHIKAIHALTEGDEYDISAGWPE